MRISNFWSFVGSQVWDKHTWKQERYLVNSKWKFHCDNRLWESLPSTPYRNQHLFHTSLPVGLRTRDLCSYLVRVATQLFLLSCPSGRHGTTIWVNSGLPNKDLTLRLLPFFLTGKLHIRSIYKRKIIFQIFMGLLEVPQEVPSHVLGYWLDDDPDCCTVGYVWWNQVSPFSKTPAC